MAIDLTLRGQLPQVKPEDTTGVSVYLVQGKTVLAEIPLAEKGQFAVGVDRQAVGKGEGALRLVLAPSELSDRLEAVADAPSQPLDLAHIQRAEKEYTVPIRQLVLNAELRAHWKLRCRRYTVKGQVVGPNGCPAPHAEVTVYNVLHRGGLYKKIKRDVVYTDNDGKFSASFIWCTHPWWPCWPCWPWWRCWPWWWEWDMLHVLEHIELSTPPRLPIVRAGDAGQPPRPLPDPLRTPPAPLRLTLTQPAGAELMRGQAFAQFRPPDARLVPDPERTALIARKLADPRIRAVFPWWWWCCDHPNLLFTVHQGASGTTVILNEDPRTDTRWCFEDGQEVTLTGNDDTVTLCPGPPPPATGFAWARVGEYVLMDHIDHGYATTWSGDDADCAFTGWLDLFGEFGPDPNTVGYYQVQVGQWLGNPARGGTAPATSTPLTVDLYNEAIVLHPDSTVTFPSVKMGPINLPSGPSNVYATQQHRQAVATTLLPAFLNPGDVLLGWAHSGRKVYTHASNLIGGASEGAARLTVTAFDNTGAALTLPPNTADTLDLEIDTTPLTAAHINNFHAYTAGGTEVTTLTGSVDCPAYDIGAGGYVTLNVTVTDDKKHVSAYEILPRFGHGSTGTGVVPPRRSYSDPVSPPPPAPPPPPYFAFPPAPYQAPDTAQKSFGGGTEDITYYPPTNCCYDFQLWAGKRTTDGNYAPGLDIYDFQTASLKVS